MAALPDSRNHRRRRFAALLERYVCERGPLPQVVKVTGTSGKGSVVAMLEAALLREGRSTGAFTSPHLVNATERIRIDGVEITTAALAARTAALEHRAPIPREHRWRACPVLGGPGAQL